MAWIDDRIWCHPKFDGLSEHAFAVYVRSVAFSCGMATGGHLSQQQQQHVRADRKARQELIDARLWDVNGDGDSIRIHDWDAHNAKRDARRAADRERKRIARSSGQT